MKKIVVIDYSSMAIPNGAINMGYLDYQMTLNAFLGDAYIPWYEDEKLAEIDANDPEIEYVFITPADWENIHETKSLTVRPSLRLFRNVTNQGRANYALFTTCFEEFGNLYTSDAWIMDSSGEWAYLVDAILNTAIRGERFEGKRSFLTRLRVPIDERARISDESHYLASCLENMFREYVSQEICNEPGVLEEEVFAKKGMVALEKIELEFTRELQQTETSVPKV